MKLVKTAAKWIALVVIAIMVYAKFQDASEQVFGLLLALIACFWAIWVLATRLDAQSKKLDALETLFWELKKKMDLPAYEWDENIDQPKL